jgi:hypothetical protein
VSDREHDFYPPPKASEIMKAREMVLTALLLPAFASGSMLPFAIQELVASHSWWAAYYVAGAVLMLLIAVLMGLAVRFRLAQCAAHATSALPLEPRP